MGCGQSQGQPTKKCDRAAAGPERKQPQRPTAVVPGKPQQGRGSQQQSVNLRQHRKSPHEAGQRHAARRELVCGRGLQRHDRRKPRQRRERIERGLMRVSKQPRHAGRRESGHGVIGRTKKGTRGASDQHDQQSIGQRRREPRRPDRNPIGVAGIRVEHTMHQPQRHAPQRRMPSQIIKRGVDRLEPEKADRVDGERRDDPLAGEHVVELVAGQPGTGAVGGQRRHGRDGKRHRNPLHAQQTAPDG